MDRDGIDISLLDDVLHILRNDEYANISDRAEDLIAAVWDHYRQDPEVLDTPLPEEVPVGLLTRGHIGRVVEFTVTLEVGVSARITGVLYSYRMDPFGVSIEVAPEGVDIGREVDRLYSHAFDTEDGPASLTFHPAENGH